MFTHLVLCERLTLYKLFYITTLRTTTTTTTTTTIPYECYVLLIIITITLDSFIFHKSDQGGVFQGQN